MTIGFVREPFLDQRLCHRDHFVDMLRSARFDIRAPHTQSAHVVVIRFDIARRDFVDRLAGFD